MKIYSADFETTTDPEDCRVWAWALWDIKTDVFTYGNNLDAMFEYLIKQKVTRLYFHNLAFDAQFIIYWLYRNGYTWVKERSEATDKTFTTLISDMNIYYSIKIYVKQDKHKPITITLMDSLKILRLKVEALPKAFGLEDAKGEIDYTAYRPVGHELTPEEIEYIKGDVRIVAHSLRYMFNASLDKMTIGADALAEYKRIIGKKYFNAWFPVPENDDFVRQSYKGGYVYVNPVIMGQDVGKGLVLDVNSLYPSRMRYCKLPCGNGVWFDGEYKEDKNFPLYVIMFKCQFEIKQGKLPTIQLKHNLAFIPTDYVTSSGYEDVALCLTSVDYVLFREHYNVYNLEFYGGYKYMCSDMMFVDYIDKWNQVKVESTHNGNTGMRTIAKALLNNLYGKFATSPIVKNKQPVYDADEDMVYYVNLPHETKQPIYIPVGTFITAYARDYTIRSSQKIRDYSLDKYGQDMYCYSDTDSIHTTLPEEDVKQLLDIDDARLGAWKIENRFDRARFLHAKCYAEEWDGQLHITVAGMPDRCYPYVTWDNFKAGAEYPGKLTSKKVRGGTVLTETTYKIKQ